MKCGIFVVHTKHTSIWTKEIEYSETPLLLNDSGTLWHILYQLKFVKIIIFIAKCVYVKLN